MIASLHGQMEPSLVAVYLLRSSRKEEADEPIKLLEVNQVAFAGGVIPVHFGPVGEVPYPSVIIELTPEEFASLQAGELSLPHGWRLDRKLFGR